MFPHVISLVPVVLTYHGSAGEVRSIASVSLTSEVFMIIRLNKAVLHVLDLDSAVSVYSKAELDLDEKPVKAYVSSLCRKSLGSTDCRHGKFASESELATNVSRYFHGAGEFVPLTTQMAQFLFGEIQRADGAKSTDMLVTDFLDGDDTRYLGLFLLEGKKAFVHEVSQADSMVSCDIVRRYGVLPAGTQRLASWALIRADNLEISYVDKPRSIDGQDVLVLPDGLLQCSSEASSRETIDCVTEIVEQVAEEHGANTALALSKAKAYVAEQVDEDESFSREGLAEQVFADSEPCQKAFSTAAEVRHLPERVAVDKRAVAQKRVRCHRIVTDTGIEVSFPAEYGENQEFIEFNTNSDGSILIELKNIGSIENK